jgi:mono/diheme cytochrome c family protein
MTGRRLYRVAVLLALALTGVIAAAAAFVYSGVYDVAATRQHTWPVFWVTDTVMRHSIARRASGTELPDLQDPTRMARGMRLYNEHCLQCHGAPGVAPEPFALGLAPVPANLVETARRWPTRNIHWVITNGVKMTGMPAWKYRMSDEQIWDVVVFVEQMARMSPNEYAAFAKLAREPGTVDAFAAASAGEAR